MITMANQKSIGFRLEQKPPSKTPVAHRKASAPKAFPAHSQKATARTKRFSVRSLRCSFTPAAASAAAAGIVRETSPALAAGVAILCVLAPANDQHLTTPIHIRNIESIDSPAFFFVRRTIDYLTS